MPPKSNHPRPGYIAVITKPPHTGYWFVVSGREVGGPYNHRDIMGVLNYNLHHYRADKSDDALPLGSVTVLRIEHSGLVSPDGWDAWEGTDPVHATRGTQPAGGSPPASDPEDEEESDG